MVNQSTPSPSMNPAPDTQPKARPTSPPRPADQPPKGQPGHASPRARLSRHRHNIFPALRIAVQSKVNVFLVGPAGSGKTTVAAQVAQSLGLRFFFNGALQSEYKLTGFRDAHGRVHRTAFREAFEHGGVYLFDEIDASQPAALLAFNAALANGVFDFPDRTVACHPDFRCIAAANTWGKGATLDYVGRNALDAATLDRFATLEMRYDTGLEHRLAHEVAKADPALADLWIKAVHAVRSACREHELRHIVSPRATLQGLSLLIHGITAEGACLMVLRRGLDETSWARIRPRLGDILVEVEVRRQCSYPAPRENPEG